MMGSGAQDREGEALGRRRPRAATARLRLETRDLHDRIERNPIAVRLMAPDVTLDDQRTMHVRLFGFHRPVVDRIGGLVGDVLPGVSTAMRDRVERLRDDLVRLGTDPGTVPMAPIASDLTIPTAVGLVYVLEGSVLGGRIIARHLADRLGLGADAGASFYADPPAGTHPRWADVCALIDDWAQAAGPAAEDSMIQAARGAFTDLDRWFSDTAGPDRSGPAAGVTPPSRRMP